jgi:hypothetical protein
MKISFWIAATLLMLAIEVPAAESNALVPGKVAGRVGYISGVMVAQRIDGTIKVLGQRSEVLAGDMLITAKNSYAQLTMEDGAQMTLRPNSNLRIESFQFRKDSPKEDKVVLRLLKGGFRSVTGLIGKRGNPDAFKVLAATANIGIRGTDFSSRLCEAQDCKDEDDMQTTHEIMLPVVQRKLVGRVIHLQGELAAKEVDGRVRQLTIGTPVYEGDVLTTEKKSYALVAFRDEGQISMQESTMFHVEKFKYDRAKSEEYAKLKLLKGGVRVVTGWIGRSNHDNYQFKLATATIGVHGTGFDAWCNGSCASGAVNPGATQGNPLDGAGVYVWAGEVTLSSPSGSIVVSLQQAAIISRDTGKPVGVIDVPPAIFDNQTPRPDSSLLDMQKLFDAELYSGDPGLYVTVHTGSVLLVQGNDVLDLGYGETGFTNKDVLMRLANTPAFMSGDIRMDPSGSGLRNLKRGAMPDGDCKL